MHRTYDLTAYSIQSNPYTADVDMDLDREQYPSICVKVCNKYVSYNSVSAIY